jgi:hypothetical protein
VLKSLNNGWLMFLTVYLSPDGGRALAGERGSTREQSEVKLTQRF